MKKRNPYDSIPESLRKHVEPTQRLTENMHQAFESQERIRAMTLPLEQISAVNDQMINCHMPTPEIITAAIEAVQNPAVIADVEVARSTTIPAAEIATKFAETMDLAALQMDNLQIDTAVLQFGNNIERIQPPNYMANIQRVLDSYSVVFATVQSPFLNWLQTVDISPIIRIWERWDTEHLLDKRYEELQKLHLQVLYKVKWFPYASTLGGEKLFDEINEIIFSSRINNGVSKRCEKRIDKAILSHYTEAEIKRIKKKWNASELEPYFKKAICQALDAYLRKEYALTIPFLATMWEGIIKSKIEKNDKKFKDNCKDLVDGNGYDEVFSDFVNNLIFGQCWGPGDVVDDIPNRNGVAHSWYIKYPSRKEALNAILMTDFVLNLKPKDKAEENENGQTQNAHGEQGR